MKLIDGKGRLFGKINIIDFAIIILILVIIPFFFHVYKILEKRPTRISHTWIKVEAVTFTIPEIAKLLKEGDTSYDVSGNLNGKLLKIVKKENEYIRKLRPAKIAEDAARYLTPVFLEFKLSCTKSAKGEPWYYERAPLYVSLNMEDEFIFHTDKYRIQCFALRIED